MNRLVAVTTAVCPSAFGASVKAISFKAPDWNLTVVPSYVAGCVALPN